MGKKRYNNYDDTVFGQYIKAIENPDSVDWDPIKRIWVAPKGKKFDSRNRGMGIDILNNIKARELTKNRPGQYLTEKEENQLRNEHIQYLLDVIDKRKKKNPALQNMSPKKQAQVLGILYRGDASKLWDKNSTLGKALQSDGDADMDRAIQQYYSSINLGERARNDAAFWNKRQPHAVKPLVDYSIKTDALRVNNPYQTQIENTIIVPQMVPNGYVEAHKLTPSEDKINKFQESMEAYKRFNTLMDVISLPNNPAPQYNPKAPYVISTHADGGFLQPQDAWDALSMREKAEMMKVAVRNGITNLQEIRKKYNEFAEGGDIHIKPENRGKFTALKERTGHSATWFKEHGTPAQKKMATFALNARHWKHGLGGNLFDGTTEDSQQMQIGLKVTNGWKPYTLNNILANAARIEQRKQAIEDRLNNVFTLSNDATSVANGRPQNTHLERKAIEGAKAHRAWEEEHPVATFAGNVLGAAPLAIAAIPAAGAAIESAPAVVSALAPGSAFWMNPITQQIAKSTLGGVSADAISTLTTGNTIGGNVRETIGWQPNNKWAKLGYELLTDMANPGYMFGAKRPGFDIVPSPIIPSRGSTQMPHGRNFGTFRPESFNNWGSESLTHLTKDYAVKVPKQSKTPVDVGPKTFDNLGWRYRAAVNQKLAANKIAGFEPYEYIGYHTTEDGYVPVFRQKRLTLMGENNPEGKIFNEEALSDIEREMRTHSGLWKSWNIGDYGPAHNIGKNAEGVGRLFDANYARDPITWIMQNFPRKWEISPIGNARLFGNTLERSANE